MKDKGKGKGKEEEPEDIVNTILKQVNPPYSKTYSASSVKEEETKETPNAKQLNGLVDYWASKLQGKNVTPNEQEAEKYSMTEEEFSKLLVKTGVLFSVTDSYVLTKPYQGHGYVYQLNMGDIFWTARGSFLLFLALYNQGIYPNDKPFEV